MDFDFSRFSPRSFERFAQTLAMRALGPGILIYGDGPDGGREAAFEGATQFPSAAKPWAGYAVVQAKYRQHGDVASDADWLGGELRGELDAYLDPSKQRRAPEFYLLITNARLSPVPKTDRGSGGIAKIEAIFEEYREAIGFKDFRVWHYDELCIRLAEAEEIRRAYTAWVTPSDVLADVLSNLTLRGSDFGTIMHRYLQREIRGQRSTRLQQAGHGGGDVATNLEDVFVDLPFQESHPDAEAVPGELLLASLLRRLRQKLSPSALPPSLSPKPDRLLLLGGPGQGKSTISQLLAQILRASVLKAETSRSMSAEAQQAVESILARTAERGLGADVPRRFPVRIDLPVYADSLSSARVNDQPLPLLSYIRDHIALVATAPELELSDLRAWLGAYPFVLLLDGLDEVPPSANRGEVITAINDLWDELASVNADALVLVATRPQGYNNDLDPALYGKLEMTPLLAEHALAYASRLAERRLPDIAHRIRVLQRMTEATETPITARLLVSPLQVAIMLALIDQRGEAPSDRWTLFEKYFSVVLEREQQKPGLAGRTVKTWSRTIGALHQGIGFALHLQAETGGGSDAQLTRVQLEALVRDQLQHDGYEGDDLERSAAELLEATTDRLVLLVQRVDQRYSFEVRSLQEFMAAAHLMSGPEVAVQERLREIANKSHWRHVFQIAASKCFSSNDTLQYRDTILQICRDLNTIEATDVALRSGARLALALIEDGLAYDTPHWRRRLLVEALDLIHTGASEKPSSVLEAARHEASVAGCHLRPHLSSGQFRTRSGAWSLVLQLAVQGCDWALALALEEWPTSPERRLEILALGILPSEGTPLHRRYRRVLAESSIDDLVPILDEQEFGIGDTALEALASIFPSLQLIGGLERDGRLKAKLHHRDGDTPLTLQAMSVEIPAPVRRMYADLPDTPGWRAARLMADFHSNPSPAALAETLRALHAEGLQQTFGRLALTMPWPLFAVLREADAGTPLLDLADEADAGLFGDLDDWSDAERRWKNVGLVEADLRKLATQGLDSDVGLCGAPNPSGISIAHGHTPPRDWLEDLTNLIPSARPSIARMLRWVVDFSIANYPPPKPFDTKLAQVLIGEDDDKAWLNPRLVDVFAPDAQSDPRVQSMIAAKAISGRVFNASDTPARGKRRRVPDLIEAVGRSPGLLPFFLNSLGGASIDHAALRAAATNHLSHSNKRVAAAANVLVMIATGGAEGNLDRVLEESPARFGLHHLMNALGTDAFDSAAALALTTRIVARLSEDHSDGFDRAFALLSRLADQRRTQINCEDRFAQLKLRGSLCRLSCED